MNLFNVTETIQPLTNESTPHTNIDINYLDVMDVFRLSIAPLGIIGNFTVIVVFLGHRKLRRKIPNRFIVNQVSIDSLRNKLPFCHL